MPLEMWLRVRIRGKLVDQLHLSTGTTRAGVRQIRRQRLLLEAQESAAQVLKRSSADRDAHPSADFIHQPMVEAASRSFAVGVACDLRLDTRICLPIHG